MSTERKDSGRILSLDQFRGYTVAGMFLVNFVGGFKAIPDILKHHNTYCSYPDTIMPQFFFAVGFAYRLTLLRRIERDGAQAAYWHSIRRCLGLLLLGFVIYHTDLKFNTWAELLNLSWPQFWNGFRRDFFQTLTHIGVTSLWVLPILAAGAWTRIAFAVFSGLVHLGLSYWFYYTFVHAAPRGIDGGVLGFLTWTIPLIAGTLAYDVIGSGRPAAWAGKFFFWGCVLMALGYGLSCVNRVTDPNHATHWEEMLIEPPFVPPAQDATGKQQVYPVNIWSMSQRAGSISYLTFATGFSLAVYALFVLVCDMGGLQLGLFRTLGVNALAGYIIHEMVAGAVKPLAPRDCPEWYAYTAFAFYFAICTILLRFLEKHKLFLRL